jgi:hypothetical protein
MSVNCGDNDDSDGLGESVSNPHAAEAGLASAQQGEMQQRAVMVIKYLRDKEIWAVADIYQKYKDSFDVAVAERKEIRRYVLLVVDSEIVV